MWKLLTHTGEENFQRMFKQWALRKVGGSKRADVQGGWRKQHIEKPHNLHTTSNIIWVFSLRRMPCTEYLAQMGEGGGRKGVSEEIRAKETVWKT
jgi:hypothetical protein